MALLRPVQSLWQLLISAKDELLANAEASGDFRTIYATHNTCDLDQIGKRKREQKNCSARGYLLAMDLLYSGSVGLAMFRSFP